MSQPSLFYRCVTGPDDGTFDQRVSEAISNGWQLYGNATMAFDSTTQRMICGQSMVKNVPDKTYAPGLDISKL
ncbi:MAG: DUF1737 domain-containing protein [Proteobacteria bacterium]|nr:DUF1737 domain-containing protein [Pseudomonadota bacterium]